MNAAAREPGSRRRVAERRPRPTLRVTRAAVVPAVLVLLALVGAGLTALSGGAGTATVGAATTGALVNHTTFACPDATAARGTGSSVALGLAPAPADVRPPSGGSVTQGPVTSDGRPVDVRRGSVRPDVNIGTRETFGINVSKVREVSRTPPITKTPNMPTGVEGVSSLRGHIIPVISLSRFVSGTQHSAQLGGAMMVTEYSRRTQGFLVEAVDRIVRVDWEKVRSPESVMAQNEGLITAITELPGGKLVSILDVEQILAHAFGEPPVPELKPIATDVEPVVFFADDSMVARKEISQVLDRLKVKYYQATNGQEAWERLQSIAQRAAQDHQPLSEQLHLILVEFKKQD